MRFSPAAIQMSKNSSEHKIQCPRCGYDLRGVMSLWENSCPLMGKCSECGLDFEWAIVSQPEKHEPQWCVEFSPGWRSVPKSSIKTLCWSFVPWKFWSQINMSHQIRKMRLFAYLCCLAIPLLLSYVSIQSGVAIYIRYKAQRDFETMMAELPGQIQSYKDSIARMNQRESLQQLSPEDREKVKNGFPSDIHMFLDNRVRMQATPPVLWQTYPDVVFEAVFNPLATSLSGYFQPGIKYTCQTPIQLYDQLFDSSSIIKGYFTGTGSVKRLYSVREIVIPTAYGVGAGTIAHLLFPLAMVLLPASRKKAKVKWSHIARVSAYSAFIPPTIILLLISLAFVGVNNNSLQSLLSALIMILCGGGIWFGLIIWWSVAIKRYLKMPHGLAVSILLCVLIVIVMSFIGAAISGYLARGIGLLL